MEANPVRVIQYFDGEKQSIIPLFQRPYSWGKTHWTVLWDDLLVQYEDKGSLGHFMGAIVSMPATTTPIGVRKHLIIDGQQRLITVALLLCALRPLVEQRNRNRIDDWIINRNFEGNEKLKLMPTHSDREAYTNIVIGGEAEKHKNSKNQMQQAIKFFQKVIRGNTHQDEAVDADRLLQTISSKIFVVMINLSEDDDPYLIFESLNFKGEPLTQADLVRNYILMQFKSSSQADGEQEEVYQNYWLPLENQLKGDLTEFLRHYTMQSGEIVRKSNVYLKVKQSVQNLQEREQIKTKLIDMKDVASIYRMITEPADGKENIEKAALLWTQSFEATTSYPLLLRFFDCYKKNGVDRDVLVYCIRLLESFYVRRLVCEIPSNLYNDMISQWCRELGKILRPEWLYERLDPGMGSRRWPSDEEFSKALEENHIYRKRKLCTYMLKSIETSYHGKERVNLDFSSVEHIMPQTLTDKWRHYLGAGAVEYHEKFADTVGNLTLTHFNSELGSQSFERKKEILKRSEIWMNKEIVIEDEWGAQQIKDRSRNLARQACMKWPRELRS